MSATIKLAVRGTQLNAYYATYDANSTYYSDVNSDGTSPSVNSSAASGVFGGYVIDMNAAANTNNKCMVYPGLQNAVSTLARSILIRIVPTASGNPSRAYGLFSMGWAIVSGIGGMQCYIDSTSKINFLVVANNGSTAATATSSALTFVANTATDILITWDGTTSAGSVRMYQDGTSVYSGAGNFTGYTPNEYLSGVINVGYAPSSNNMYGVYLNEFVLWEGVVSISYPRSAFISVANFDGAYYTDPGIANVRTGTSYYVAGTQEIGTCAVPTASQVLNGVSVDATTGNVTLPTASQVLNGVTFGASSGTTGNVVLPTTAQVQTGVTFGASSGSTGTYTGSDRWTDPGSTNVRSGVAYKANSTTNNETGSCAVPTASQVLNGVSVDATTGNVVLPTAGQVQTGVTFGASSGTTGTYTGSDRWTDPGASNVLLGVAYKANSTTNNETGTLTSTDPGVANVTTGVGYEINSVANTGTNVSTDPGITNVLAGVTYEINNVSKTGTLTSTDPGVSNVKSGTTYEINNVSKTGTNVSTDPGVGNVLIGVDYEINNTPLVGTYAPVSTEFVSLVLVGQEFAGAIAEGIVPQIAFTQGDTAVLNLQCQNGQGIGVDLTGATLTTFIKGANGVVTSFPNSQHNIPAGFNGNFTLNLGAQDTANCGTGSAKTIITLVTLDGSVTQYFQGIGVLTVYPPVPLQ